MGAAMALGRVAQWRIKIAYSIFALSLIWPLLHMALVHIYGFSSWRFFGWGMYATPNPESQTRLHVILATDNREPQAIPELHRALSSAILDPDQESNCVNVFVENDSILHRLPPTNLCRNDAHVAELEEFLQLRATEKLNSFVHAALHALQQPSHKAVAFVTHQRLNLWQQKAYLESDVYKIENDAIIYMGKVKNEAL